MRTIKFKAKTLEDREWIVGDLVCVLCEVCIKPESKSEELLPICKKVDPDTVCQFTGLLDKNGKEIYEGDVLRSDKYPFSCIEANQIDIYYGAIGWSDEGKFFYMVVVKNPKSSVMGISDGISDTISQKMMQDFEVIGNVHDLECKQYREYIQDEDEEQHQ